MTQLQSDNEKINQVNDNDGKPEITKKTKKKSVDGYFNDPHTVIMIKKDGIINGSHKYKVAFTQGEKTETIWVSENKMNERAPELIEEYNSRPKTSKKKKQADTFETSPHSSTEVVASSQTSNPKKVVEKSFKVDPDAVKSQKDDRIIEKIFGLKNRENSHFPDFIVKFADSEKPQRVSWKKMHQSYKLQILAYYESNITEDDLTLYMKLPDGLEIEPELHVFSH